MPKGQWLHRAAVGLLVVLSGSLHAQQPQQPAPQQPQATHPAPDASSTLRSIFNDAVERFAREKAESAFAEKRKEDREKSDLAAQWEQSLWAQVAAIAGALSLIVGSITLIFLWKTFRETRRTADAAIEAAKAARESGDAAIALELPIIKVRTPILQRLKGPQLLPDAITAPQETMFPGKYSTVRGFYLGNHGRTIASLHGISVGWEWGKNLTAPVYRFWSPFGGVAISTGGDPEYFRTDFVIDLEKSVSEALINKGMRFWLHASVEYEDFLGNLRADRFCWEWMRRAPAMNYNFYPAFNVPPSYTRKSLIDRENYHAADE